MPLSCDCFPGCWGTHSKDWPSFELPQEDDEANEALKKLIRQIATNELPYGTFVAVTYPGQTPKFRFEKQEYMDKMFEFLEKAQRRFQTEFYDKYYTTEEKNKPGSHVKITNIGKHVESFTIISHGGGGVGGGGGGSGYSQGTPVIVDPNTHQYINAPSVTATPSSPLSAPFVPVDYPFIKDCNGKTAADKPDSTNAIKPVEACGCGQKTCKNCLQKDSNSFWGKIDSWLKPKQ